MSAKKLLLRSYTSGSELDFVIHRIKDGSIFHENWEDDDNLALSQCLSFKPRNTKQIVMD